MAPPFQFRGNGGPNRSGDRGRRPPREQHKFTFRAPRLLSERPLLVSKRETTPEQLQAEHGEKPALKFASLDALSNSEEAEMEFSDDSDEDARPRKKRNIGSGLGTDGVVLAVPAEPPKPKWSNPDPYTALPPPDESHKRVDVIQLIRKARLANITNTPQSKAVVANEDFISLGMSNENKKEDRQQSQSAPVDAPKGPRGLPPLASRVEPRAPQHVPNGPMGLEVRGTATKRTRDDEPKGISPRQGKPKTKFNRDGSVHQEWRPRSGQNCTPWLESVTPASGPSVWFHNECVAYYKWVRPEMFEDLVRADLINRLSRGFERRYGKVQLRPFGSFASGLYLPVADIDLVLLSPQFRQTGRKFYGLRKGQIYAFSAYLRDMQIAVPGSIETIAHARVPILKFIDKLTGLRVDLSFDNDSGILANETFDVWKNQFPVMPVVVSIIKQFLLIRGLNEVATGGLGGFSITCLVVSVLQHLPDTFQQNVGHVLLHFFDFYGNVFDYRRNGIRMIPAGFVNKTFESKDRLSIEDPNNPDNDISGGTKEIPLIFHTFREAHRVLRDMMHRYHTLPPGTSILEKIIAANFDEYDQQRFQLFEVYRTAPQFHEYRTAPPPPPAEAPPSIPPPPPGAY
ncbi:hypothetical protein N7488_002471 [Penicillium malachiteum]|nr:hypothetical protein N7488_002471 [Penicillium malachiteum]